LRRTSSLKRQRDREHDLPFLVEVIRLVDRRFLVDIYRNPHVRVKSQKTGDGATNAARPCTQKRARSSQASRTVSPDQKTARSTDCVALLPVVFVLPPNR
jgi:hypothetical protein